MLIRIIMAIALALLFTTTGTLYASDIYKWTDEDGNVHYSDTPTEGAEHLEIESRPTDPAHVQAEVQARVDAEAIDAEEEANAPQGPTPEELQAEARERQEQCNKYTERQTQFTRSRRIYRMDEAGERVYYDEEEMQAARDDVDDKVREYCN